MNVWRSGQVCIGIFIAKYLMTLWPHIFRRLDNKQGKCSVYLIVSLALLIFHDEIIYLWDCGVSWARNKKYGDVDSSC